ncbi:SMI1/KNR4 family protein [Luteolibacter sp. GHJ8]|uniref:SMI1/KNR4 family protein n=2 Tax=Luteolibacter rhizosphaerae TaxID=2989719 RepID=A0ABT3G6T5_9BACT|nr:SMI1/KNR4 family protein [Luteolibacter rhizosphaerae]
MDQRLENFTTNPPADCNHLADAETHFGKPLPTQYRRFMAEQDGGEGFVGDQYLILWRAAELVEFHREYEAEKYAPGLVLFGSNGGGEAFAFDTREGSMRIVMVPFVGMSLKDVAPVADSFENFLSNLADGTLT